MPYVLIGFLLGVIVVLLLFRSPTSGINLVANWRLFYKMLSVQLATLASFLVAAIPVVDQFNAWLPTFESLSALKTVTQTHAYQLFAACVAAAAAIGRLWEQGKLRLAAAEAAAKASQAQPVAEPPK